MNSQFATIHQQLIGLRKNLCKAARSRACTIAKMRKIAEARAEKVLDNLQACATTNGVSVVCMARNIAATVPASGTPAFAGLLKFWLIKAPFEPDKDHEALVEAMYADSAESEVLGWLLGCGEPPSPATVAHFFHKDIHALLLFDLKTGKRRSERKSADTARFLKLLFLKLKCPLDETSRSDLLKGKIGKKMPKIDEPDFQKFPVKIRRWVLDDLAFARQILASPFRERVLANPVEHPDTPQAIAHAKWLENYPIAIEDLGSGRFASPSVDYILSQDLPRDRVTDEIISAINQNYSSSENGNASARIPSDLADYCSGNVRLGKVLQFFSLPKELRLCSVRELRGKRLNIFVQDVSVPLWLEAILQCNDSGALEDLRPSILSQRVWRDSLLSLLVEKSTSHDFRSVFAKDAILRGDVEAAMSLLDSYPEFLRHIEPADLPRHKVSQLLAGHLRDEDRFMRFVTNGATALVEAVIGSEIPSIRKALPKLIRLASTSDNLKFRMTVFRLVLFHEPQALAKRRGIRISEEEFITLLLKFRKAEILQAVFKLRGKRGIPCWELCFRQKNRHALIRNRIKTCLPELLPRLEELESKKLLARPGFKPLLRKILAGKESAATLGVPQRSLRYLIPWARKTWKDKPTLAVAYELALAFSIADARYLTFLCSERWESAARDRGGYVFDHHYKVHALPKNSGGNRLVTVPSDELKRLQRRILRSGLDGIFLHPAAHGFRSKHSILTNALPHVGHPCVVNIDIKSFFPNTRYSLILNACSMLAGGVLSEAACHVLADICSYGGGLPTGAPTSPALANLILRSADTSIAKAAQANAITYTRYADDLTFSGESNVLKILPFVSRVLGQLGYQLDEKKTNIFRRGRRQMVTGLVVNEKPNLPRRIRRRLRAAVHQASNGGQPKWHGKRTSKAKLLGRLGHLGLVQPEEAKALRKKLMGDGKGKKSKE